MDIGNEKGTAASFIYQLYSRALLEDYQRGFAYK
jgi:hypothetical protein